MNRLEALQWLKKEFLAIDIEDAEQEARYALSFVLQAAVSDLYVFGALPVEEAFCRRLEQIAARRSNGEPLAYILGERDFMGMPMEVDASVLIPRQETELLCEKAIALIREKGFSRVLDLCTGSGCIAVSLRKFTGANITASDISDAALAVAKKNAAQNGTEVNFVQSDLFLNIFGEFDLIVSNPPYISEQEYASLPAGIRAFEPALALKGGEDGLAFYRRIVRAAPAHLRPGGMLMLEIGEGQADAVRGLLKEAGFDKIAVWKDYAGLHRIAAAEKETAEGGVCLKN